ncbi:hypothetical protein HV417_10705 [Bacillus sporothermodurans]|uniref:hypothetical protein n=1 Tax=Heyndrickxia sporothermodurans TaxID=46224 RepID=UPI00192AF151|nr:hypothetical protein [Heyndrickxia sporothermodurans]MBL5873977.1 hypothetical protein [Heyndrickxia sporothermodurans]
MKKSFRLVFVACIILVFMVSGCSSNSSTGAKKSGEGGKDKTTLVLAQSADITTLDPQNSLSTTGDRVFRNMFSRLFGIVKSSMKTK